MSIDFRISLAVGYVIPEAELTRVFGKVTPEVFHLEERFDQKTGKKTEPAKVVDKHGYTQLFYKGKEATDGAWDLAEALARDLGSQACPHGSSGRMSWVIGPDLSKLSKTWDDDEVQESHVTCSGGVPFFLMAECVPRLAELKKQLLALGLKVEDPVVVPACWIS